MRPPIDKLTAAQRAALEFAISDGELQIGGIDGRKVRRDVAERLVGLGLLVRTNTPTPHENWWAYKIAQTIELLSVNQTGAEQLERVRHPADLWRTARRGERVVQRMSKSGRAALAAADRVEVRLEAGGLWCVLARRDGAWQQLRSGARPLVYSSIGDAERAVRRCCSCPIVLCAGSSRYLLVEGSSMLQPAPAAD